jgi:uncharacterized protein (UPF0276 family)
VTDQPSNLKKRYSLPVLGSGVGLRKEYFTELPATTRPVDFVEIISENFMGYGGRSRRALDACAERWPIVPHGVCLNIGGPDPLDLDYLDKLRVLCERLDVPWFSDHLCFTAVGHAHSHDLLPLPFSKEALEHVVPRVKEVQARVGRPFLLENPSFYQRMPTSGPVLEEAELLATVAEEADCGLLLDVNNVYVNSQNHAYDPVAFLDRIPAERVVQIHLAGHHRYGDLVIDTHGAAAIDEVWRLYQHTLSRTGPVATLYEWDNEIPSLDAVLDQADQARGYLDASIHAAGHAAADAAGALTSPSAARLSPVGAR